MHGSIQYFFNNHIGTPNTNCKPETTMRHQHRGCVCYFTAAYMGLNFLFLGSGGSGPSASLCNQNKNQYKLNSISKKT